MKKHYFCVRAIISLNHRYRYKEQPHRNETENEKIDFLEILEIEQGESEPDDLFYRNLKFKIARVIEIHIDTNLKQDKLSKPEEGFTIRSTVNKQAILNISRVG